MARNYYRCPNCGTLDLIVYRAADTEDPETWPPRCQTVRHVTGVGTVLCAYPMELAPQPGDFHMDALRDGGTNQPFQKFTVHVNGGPVEIDSIHKARLIERESEQRYRDGEGEPIRFRMLNQDRSNVGVNSFGEAGTIGGQAYSSGQQPQPRRKPEIRRHGEKKPRIGVGPGMARSGATALKD